jgi:Spy/CpxP family protein refolding chaperone
MLLGLCAYALVSRILEQRRTGLSPSDAGVLAYRLQLRHDQQERIGQITAEFHQEREAMRLVHREHRRELVFLLGQTPPDRKRIAQKLDEAGDIQREMQQLAVNHVLDVSAQLDEEQRERLFALIDAAICPGEVLGRGGDCR